jgi:hypothetical protein
MRGRRVQVPLHLYHVSPKVSLVETPFCLHENTHTYIYAGQFHLSCGYSGNRYRFVPIKHQVYDHNITVTINDVMQCDVTI